MADGTSQKAWEIITSHRIQDSEDAAEIDAYLNGSPVDHRDLVDGWLSVLAPPLAHGSLSPSELERTSRSVHNEGCIDLDRDPSDTDSSLMDEYSKPLDSKQRPENGDTDKSQHCSLQDLGAALLTPAASSEPVRSCDSARPDVDSHRIEADSCIGASRSFCGDELLDAVNLIETVNCQLADDLLSDMNLNDDLLTSSSPQSSSDVYLAAVGANSVTTTHSDSPEKYADFDQTYESLPAGTAGDDEAFAPDPSLEALTDVMQGGSVQLLSGISGDLSALSINLAQCMIEKSLLDEEMQRERLLYGELPTMAYGEEGEERYVLYPQLSDLSTLLVPDSAPLSTTDHTSVSPLEAQIMEFVDRTTEIVKERVERWTKDIQSSLECESVISEEEGEPTTSVEELPDEVLLRILSYIPLMTNLCVVSLVCRRWYILAADPSLWQQLHIPTDSAIDPHWLCYMASKSPQLKVLSLRGGHNIREESLSVLTHYCPLLTSVDFGFCNITPPMLSNLVTRCPHISSANFEGCETVSSQWLNDLCKLQKLTSINISHCMTLVDDDIVYLSEHLSSLVHVNIDGNSFLSDRSVVALCTRHCRSLLTLSIDGAESTDSSVEAVATCSNLNLFTISFAENLTAACISHIVRLKWLLHLQIRKNTNLDDAMMLDLFSTASLQHLYHLDLSECMHVSDAVVASLCRRCPMLRRLVLGWCWNITDVGVSHIVDTCDHLEYLDLLGLDVIEGYSFDRLPTKLPNLTFLNLVQCNKIKDVLIQEVLDRMPRLTAINFYHEDFRTAI